MNALADVDNADAWLVEAQRHYVARAFTPFWEACESAMVALAEHRQGVEMVRRAVSDHQEALKRLATEAPELLSRAGIMPDGVIEAENIAAGSHVADRVLQIVYSAQSDFQFASIFEQRRTTAAVVDGFRNMSEAFAGMSRVIGSSYAELSSAVRSLDTETAHIHQSLNISLDTSQPNSYLGGQVRDINLHLRNIANRR